MVSYQVLVPQSAHDVVGVLGAREPGSRALGATFNVAEVSEATANVSGASWTSSVFTMDNTRLRAQALWAWCWCWPRSGGSACLCGDEFKPAMEGGCGGGGAHPARPSLGNVVCLVHFLQACTLISVVVSRREELPHVLWDRDCIAMHGADQTTSARPLHILHTAVACTGLEFTLDFTTDTHPAVAHAAVLLDVGGN